MVTLVFFSACAAPALGGRDATINITFHDQDALVFDVTVGGAPWLRNEGASVRARGGAHATSDGSLAPAGPWAPTAGEDARGAYAGGTRRYETGDGDAVDLSCFRRADLPRRGRGDAAAAIRGRRVATGRGDAAAAMRGDGSRRRRGWDMEIPWSRGDVDKK